MQLILVLIGVFVVSNLAIAQADSTSGPTNDSLNPQLIKTLRLPPPTSLKKLPQTITNQDITKLFEKYQQRAAKLAGVADNYVATFDLLLNKDMVMEKISLNYQLNMALGEQRLFDFETIGLKQIDQFTFTYLNQIPLHFLEPRDYIKDLIHIEKIFYINELKNRGFRKSDIRTLTNYINNTDATKDEAITSNQFMLQRLPELKRISFSSNHAAIQASLKHFRNEMIYRMSYRSAKQWRQWMFNLLSQFDLQRQRILKSFLIEKIYSKDSTYTISISSPTIVENSILQLENSIVSGELEAQLLRQKQKLQKQKTL